MPPYNIRKEVYLDRKLADKVDDAEQPDSEFIREAIRHQLQRLEGELNQ